MANNYFLYHLKEESISYINIHYVNTKALWLLLFFLFDISWVLPSLAKETLMRWHKSFMGKKNGKKSGELLLYVYFGQFERKKTADHQKIKSILFKGWNTFFFFCNLWDWPKLFIIFGTLCIINFFDWLNS